MMNRCTKCVLPESTPGIAFDPDGICNYCSSYQMLVYQGEDELVALLDSHRRTDNRYDCMVTLSGGRDSTYTLLKLVKDYGMRVLAVNYENPFTDAQARANIEKAVKALNVDLVQFHLPNKLHERTLRGISGAWFQKPSPGLVPMVCIACKTIWWNILCVAKEYDIQCIVSGGNRYEDVSFKKVLLGVSANEHAEATITKALTGLVKENVKHLSYLKPVYIPTMIKGYLFADPYTIGSRLWGRNVSKIDLFFYIRWNEQQILSRIRSELDWDYPRSLNSSWRFDCRVGHLKDFMYKTALGLTEKDDFYAKTVREGVFTREEALQRVEAENAIHLDEVEALLRDSGVGDTSFLHAWRD